MGSITMTVPPSRTHLRPVDVQTGVACCRELPSKLHGVTCADRPLPDASGTQYLVVVSLSSEVTFGVEEEDQGVEGVRASAPRTDLLR